MFRRLARVDCPQRVPTVDKNRGRIVLRGRLPAPMQGFVDYWLSPLVPGSRLYDVEVFSGKDRCGFRDFGDTFLSLAVRLHVPQLFSRPR